ncbi:MAG TPA: hypothetical protein VFO79_13535 [Xanthomonadales bacterium]|nr:hypothetical protein [Xanthomonadales bacterium]
MSFRVSEPFAPRRTEYLGAAEFAGYRMKRYAIVHGDAALDRALYSDAIARFTRELPQPPSTVGRPGVGFLICHQGRGVHYLVICSWERENELAMRIFIRSTGGWGDWHVPGPGHGPCVWDLAVIGHERDAYVRHVLTEARGDLDAYLADAAAAT